MSRGSFPLGAAVTVAELTADPHPALRRLRAAEPASWVPALGGWLVTRYDLAEGVLRDDTGFTVDDPRFTTARVTGPSMLSTDGAEHRRHRDPFARALRRRDVTAGLAASCAAQAGRLTAALRAQSPGAGDPGRAELRRGLAGPLAAGVMAELLGLPAAGSLLAWYDAIVTGVSELAEAGPRAAVPAPAAAAYAQLRACLDRAPPLGVTGLGPGEASANAAVLLFGGIETTEGMICNAAAHLLSSPAALAAVRADPALLPAAVGESLRLEPAAAVVDRYATADTLLGTARVRAGDLVIVSLAGACRDPAVFADPDRFDLHRYDPGRASPRPGLAFAAGPHFCPGAGLARTETETAITALLAALPGLRLDPDRPAAARGLVFRKPPELHVLWDAPPARRGTRCRPAPPR